MPHNTFAIPLELRQLPQWVCWKYEDIGAKKPTKVPYDPKTGKMASTDDPTTWSAFEVAFNAAALGNYSGIGFVFTANDPYAFIDLDDTRFLADGSPNPTREADLERQLKIFTEFNSYSEVSPSGQGLHIIIRGSIPAGRRRNGIEVYSTGRYATMTGNVHLNVPIVDAQDKLMQLWEQIGGSGIATYVHKGDDIQKFTDEEILAKASNAVNGEKFKTLLAGRWQELYQSQSEADFAFVDILGFYSQNRVQIERMFKASPLGQRKKAQRSDYLNYMLARVFDNIPAPIDFDGFKNALETKLAQQQQQQLELGLNKANPPPVKQVEVQQPLSQQPYRTTVTLPPGLLGDIAQFIYQAAPRPVPEIALAAAIGLMAGITGRAYNVSGTGLNQYVLLLAMTGAGKEAMAIGIEKLMNTIKSQVPTSSGFLGPSEIASGQALIKYLSKTSQCFVSVLGEFGLRLQQISSASANGSEVALRRMLLDLYNKSAYGQTLRPSVYSDKDKNTDAVPSPAFTILGESVPERFYGILNEEMISEGLLPRFLLIEYTGPRPELNPHHTQAVPSFALTANLAALAAQAEVVSHANPRRVINVEADQIAKNMLNEFDKFCDNRINGTNQDVIRQLWNRAHMKVLKLSALVAVGVNMADPLITQEYVEWAMHMVRDDIRKLTDKFEAGEVGTSTTEIKQAMELSRVVKEFCIKPWDLISRYTDAQRLHQERIIPYSYLNRRLGPLSAYRLDKQGATAALKRTLQTLIDSDKIREIPRAELGLKFGTSQRAFVVNDLKLLD